MDDDDTIVGAGVGFRRMRRSCCRIADIDSMDEAMRNEERDRTKNALPRDAEAPRPEDGNDARPCPGMTAGPEPPWSPEGKISQASPITAQGGAA